jgi:hypothetical protein
MALLLALLLRMRWPAQARPPLAVLICSRLPSGSRSSISHPKAAHLHVRWPRSVKLRSKAK